MNFELNKIKALLGNVNPRRELHGDEPKPAGDLRVQADLASDSLDMFHPELRALLYHFDPQIGGDLVDAANKDADPKYAPHLRLPHLAPLKWKQDIIGAAVVVHYGVDSEIRLELCNVGEFHLEPKQGGTVALSFRVQAHPDEPQFGKLCSMIGTDIEISVTPPKAEAEDLLETKK